MPQETHAICPRCEHRSPIVLGLDITRTHRMTCPACGRVFTPKDAVSEATMDAYAEWREKQT